MLKWIVLAVVLALLWSATLVFDLPPVWLSIVLTLLGFGAVIGVLVFRRLRARRAARDLERALAAQAAEQARMARPDLQLEIHEMQAEFQKAIAALKSSKLGRGGADALYALPWYAIIGPPGVGKTTALKSSGLQFPYLSKTGGAVRGVGGTRNCDWWLTNEGVLLDTAGRWSTADEDRQEWHSFLDLLARFRPRKPLNGLIVAVALSEVAGGSEDEVIALAKQLRDRVDEVLGQLKMSLPVYLFLTKVDLVPGFVESFADLDRTSRGQVWGFTAPLGTPATEPGAYFQERFEELVQAVEQRALRRMGDERRVDVREAIFEFPQQLGAVTPTLTEFVRQLFSENVFQETPRLRGVYLTSGTQEGRPIDRLMSRMAEAFGIQQQLPTQGSTTDPKSYFLRDVFSQVIFADKELAARSAVEQLRQRRRRWLTAGAISLVALLISTFPAYAWFNSRALLQETLQIADAAAEGGSEADLERYDELRARTELLRSYEEDGAPLSMRLGMYQGDTIYPPLRSLYTRLVRESLVEPVFRDDLSDMEEFGRNFEAFPNARPSAEEHGRFYSVLKSHLLLTSPAEAGQPPLSDEEAGEQASEDARALQRWLAGQLLLRWMQETGLERGSPEAERMQAHLVSFVALLPEDDTLLFPRDAQTVQRARNALNRVSGESLALNQMIAQFEGRGYDLTLDRLVGTTGALEVRREAQIRGAFTRRAWEESVFETLAASPGTLLGEGWVLGLPEERGQATEEQLDALRSAYFRQYVGEWRDFLDRIAATATGTHVEALRMAQALTSGDPAPQQALFQQVAYHTTLPVPQEEEEDDGEGEGAEGALTESILEEGRRRMGRFGRVGQAVFDDALQRAGERWTAPPPVGGVPDTDPRYVAAQFDGFTRFGVAPAPADPAAPQQAVPLDLYLEQLRFVRDALQTFVDDEETADELMGKLQTARTVVRGQIEEQQVGWRPNFERLLWPPIDSAAENSSRALGISAGRSWCQEVVQPWRESIRGRYPFRREGHDVPLEDFHAFFAPEDGALWSFYDEVLKSSVPLEGSEFRFARRLGRDASNVFKRTLLAYLDDAHEVRRTFYPPGAGAGPRVDFDVRIRPSPRVATIALTVDEQIVSYENAPERWTRFTWPNDEAQVRGARLEVRGEGGLQERLQEEGEWGVFRLLEVGTVASRGGGVFTVVWRLHTHDVDITMDFRPARDVSPFFGAPGRRRSPALLAPARTELDPPSEIVVGERVCRR